MFLISIKSSLILHRMLTYAMQAVTFKEARNMKIFTRYICRASPRFVMVNLWHVSHRWHTKPSLPPSPQPSSTAHARARLPPASWPFGLCCTCAGRWGTLWRMHVHVQGGGAHAQGVLAFHFGASCGPLCLVLGLESLLH